VEVLVLGRPAGPVKLRPLKKLGLLGIQSVLLEGGPTLNAGALEERIVDRILLFVAPKIIGLAERPRGCSGRGSPADEERPAGGDSEGPSSRPDLMVEAKPLYG
jgi:diaminohydroxyphosphoribosylaminopyrimidine deaminase/5-amino-6-(5-phosphoribosylamino)uracil reductase